MKKIILSFDLEFWYNSKFIGNYIKESDTKNDVAHEATKSLLKILKKHNIQATFFVLGKFAEKYPELIDEISQSGHEIASHGYSHAMLDNLEPDKFEEELKRTEQILKKVTGKKVKGFRAPAFSLNTNTTWAVRILKKIGYTYDSSIFPKKMGLYGINLRNKQPYPISTKNIKMEDKSSKLVEFPITVWWHLPLGGFYFRFTPFWIQKIALKQILKSQNAVMYLHPHELLPFIPNIGIPWWKKTLKYWGVHSAMNKLDKLLSTFPCTTHEHALKGYT